MEETCLPQTEKEALFEFGLYFGMVWFLEYDAKTENALREVYSDQWEVLRAEYANKALQALEKLNPNQSTSNNQEFLNKLLGICSS